jgi:hypothetical protein
MDDLTRVLLTQLAGDGDASVADIVAQSLGDDPMAAVIAQRLASAEAESDDDDGQAGVPADPEVADLLERLYDEIELLRERIEPLADALGACRRCFGEDELCPVCNGRGRPGGRAPDPTLFAEIVVPAWERRTGRAADLELFVNDEDIDTRI